MRLLIASSLLLALACSKEMPFIIGKESKTQYAAAEAIPKTSPVLQGVLDATEGDFLEATYKVKVKLDLFRFELCNSNIKAAVSKNLGTDGNPIIILDESEIKCKFGVKLDLIKVLAGLGIPSSVIGSRSDGSVPQNSGQSVAKDLSKLGDNIKKIVSIRADDNAIYFDSLLNTKYSPSRALIPNIISGEESVLATFDATQEITVQDTRMGDSATGRIRLKMSEWKKRYKSDYIKDIAFNDTALMKVEAWDFGSVNTIRVFIPKEMKVRISRDPFAILSVKTKVKILDALGLGQSKQQVKATIEQAQRTGGIVTNLMLALINDFVWVNVVLREQAGIEELVNQGARDSTDNL